MLGHGVHASFTVLTYLLDSSMMIEKFLKRILFYTLTAIALSVFIFLVYDKHAPIDTKGFEVYEHTLENIRLTAPLPNVWEVRKNERSVTFDFSERLRKSMTVSVNPLNKEIYTDTYKFRNGNILQFSLNDDMGGGSGGTESMLWGKLTDENGLHVYIYCYDQGEWSTNPEWCIKYWQNFSFSNVP